MVSDKAEEENSASGAPSLRDLEIIELIAKTAQSSLYKARQLKLDRLVAVKVLTGLCGPENIERFLQEARLTGKINHPNSVQLIYAGSTDAGLPYLVLEYLEGSTLARRLQERGPLSLQEFRDIFPPLLSALSQAHELKLIHRDIKPENIMICRGSDGCLVPKLLDFDIARLSLPDSSAQKLTATGAITGSPAYMSPEQCLNKPLDCRSDLYSLACVMYESLLGEPPFSGNSSLELMDRHVNAPPLTVSQLAKRLGFGPELPTLILRGLEKSADKRPQSASEFARALKTALGKINPERVPLLKSKQSKSPGLNCVMIFVFVVAAAICAFLGTQQAANKHASILPAPTGRTALFHEASLGKELYMKSQKAEALKHFELAIQGLKNDNDPAARQLLLDIISQAVICAGNLQHENKKNIPAAEEALKKSVEYSDLGIQLMPDAREQDLFSLYFAKISIMSSSPARINMEELRRTLNSAAKRFGKTSSRYLEILFITNYNLLAFKRGHLAAPTVNEALQIAGIRSADYESLRAQAGRAALLASNQNDREGLPLARKIAARVTALGTKLNTHERFVLFKYFLLLSYQSKNRLDLFETLLKDEVATNFSAYSEQPGDYADIALGLADAYYSFPEVDKALEQAEQALRVLDPLKGYEAERTKIRILDYIAYICRKNGRQELLQKTELRKTELNERTKKYLLRPIGRLSTSS